MAKKVGYEAELYYGAAGSQAATQLTCSGDIDYDVDTETGEVTCRGDGSTPPIKSERVTGLSATLTWKMVNKSTDSALAALIAAAAAGTPVALYYLDYSGGRGFDGDVILKYKNSAPLKGEQTYEFTAVPNDDLRTPDLDAA